MLAKLLCIANWPKDSRNHPEYPITFELNMDSSGDSANWIDCRASIKMQSETSQEPSGLVSCEGQMLKRDIQRLAHDLKNMISQADSDHMTFVPITPLFEMWVNRLSDDQYRIIIWQDMANQFGGAADIGHHGIRFMSNRARLMGFIRGLDSVDSQS